jgi:hypothetical protein
MSALRAQQRQLAAAIVGQASATMWLGGDAAPASSRLQVYRHAYRARLTEALRTNFPVLHRVLGDDAFAELAQDYLAERPSRRPSIRWFGDGLVDHLRRHPDRVSHPALVDLARMEWALGLSFDSADAPVLRVDDLTAVAPEQWAALVFSAHPSVSLLDLAWRVEALWRTLTLDPQAEADAPTPSAHALLVWRQGGETRWRSVPDDEVALLTSCLAGEPFGALCSLAAASAGQGAAAGVAGALRRWVEEGLLAAVRPGRP